jgi:hypothetical protein
MKRELNPDGIANVLTLGMLGKAGEVCGRPAIDPFA